MTTLNLNEIESSLQLLNIRAKKLEDWRSTNRQTWNDSASQYMGNRYLNPHQNLSAVLQQAVEDQKQHLELALDQFENANQKTLEAGKNSIDVIEDLQSAKNKISESESAYNRCLDKVSEVEDILEEVARLLNRANNACHEDEGSPNTQKTIRNSQTDTTITGLSIKFLEHPFSPHFLPAPFDILTESINFDLLNRNPEMEFATDDFDLGIGSGQFIAGAGLEGMNQLGMSVGFNKLGKTLSSLGSQVGLSAKVGEFIGSALSSLKIGLGLGGITGSLALGPISIGIPVLMKIKDFLFGPKESIPEEDNYEYEKE